ncbi:MAG: bacitracin synthase 1 [Acidobacteriota bacterium]|nr:bacitracin synthase 1 [Acidobacteriota bacterium]
MIEKQKKIDCTQGLAHYTSDTKEIEYRIRQYKGIKNAAVIVVEVKPGEWDLCAYVVPTLFDSLHMIDRLDLREYLSAHLPGHMIPVYVVILEELPLTAVGEIDPTRLPLPEKPGDEKYAAPRDWVEKKLVDIWSDVLHLDEKHIGIDSDFADLGGHSLSAVRLLGKIHKEFDVLLAMKDVLNISTIRGLGQLIKKRKTMN